MKATWKHIVLEKTARFGRDPFALLIVVLAGLGTAHILVRTAPYGATVITDSFYFLSTALNFLAGEGWRDFLGRPLVGWPPLFPLLLAAGGWVGVDPLEAGRWVNAVAFGLTILAAGGWLYSNLRSRWLALVATAIITASLPLSDWAAHFMTDPLFVLFTLLALMQLGAFLNRKIDAPLWWAAVLTALAALTRYPGVVLIGVGVLMLLVRRAPPLAVRLKHAVAYGAVASLPLAGVLVRNWVIKESLTGHRKESGQSLSDVLSRVADVCRAWVIPPNAPDGFDYLLWTAAGLVVAAGAVVVGSGLGLGSGGKDRPASPLFGLGPIIPFGGFAVAYLLFIVAIVPLVIQPQIPARYLLPVYVPLLLAAVFLLDRFLSIKAAGWMGAAQYGLASLVLLGALAHIGYSTRENLRITIKAYGGGYYSYNNTAHWQQSLNYIRNHHIEGRIYSNHGPLAWFGDRTAAPGKYQQIRAGLPRLARDMMQETKDSIGAHIVWFRSFGDQGYYGYDDLDLRLLPGIEIVAELADGVVFRVTTAEPFDEAKHRARKERYVDQLIQQASEQVSRTGWTVYRTGRTLIYRKKPCAPADVQAKFVLHVVPADPADLPADRQQYDSENLDFYFNYNSLWSFRFNRNSLWSFRLGDQCIAITHLPAYAIDRIHIGQWISKENRTLWEAEFLEIGE